MKRRILAIAAAGLAVAIGSSVEVGVARHEVAGVTLLAPVIKAEGAMALPARRVARRTARRTTARMNYVAALPGGCVLRGLYHYCGGVYYQPVQQDGATVYVVVTP